MLWIDLAANWSEYRWVIMGIIAAREIQPFPLYINQATLFSPAIDWIARTVCIAAAYFC